jgi:lysozyme
MGSASWWRAAIWFAVALLAASGVAGLAPAVPAAGSPAVADGSPAVADGSPAVADGSPGGPPPVPTVDGVQRFNVGATHSPALLRELAGPLAETGRAAAPAALGGVDVAAFQHPGGAAINWTKVASAGYRFAFIKATEGNYYVNPYYASDLAQAKAAGLYAAGYHFAIPDVSDGGTQADYAVNNGGYTADGRTLPLVLDIEYDPYTGSDHTNECYGLSAAKMVAWITAFAAEVQRLTQQPPIIYSTADWWNTCTKASTAAAADPLWIAAWSTGNPRLPAGWAGWTYWQYTSGATVPGITGAADASYFNAAMVALLDPGAQSNTRGTGISLQVNSLNAAAGQTLSYSANGLPAGLSIGGALITGTVQAQPGTYPVTVAAAGPSGTSQSVSFTWTVTAGPTGTGEITGYAGKCVDDWRSATANGNKVDLYSCNGTAAQQWTLTASGQLQIFGKCLDDTGWGGQGTRVELYTCNGGGNQQWTHLANGEYVLASNGLCLNDPGNATANGTQLIVWACANTSNERWSGPA